MVMVVRLPLLLAVAVVACAAAPEEHRQLFGRWQREHSRTYDSSEEESHRFGVWRENHEMIEKHNAARTHEHELLLGHSQFSDATHAEFKGRMLSRDGPPLPLAARRVDDSLRSVSAEALPEAVDWRDPSLNHAKIVGTTSVKNQMWCGSCWAFSTTAALESLQAITSGHGPPVSLSEQMLMDCGSHFVPGSNSYCNGGDPMAAFWYINNTGGICSDADYPYDIMSNASMCTGVAPDYTPTTCKPVFRIGGEKKVPLFNETALAAAVARQVVSININANAPWFAFYKGGIVKDLACSSITDHAVSIVGFGTYPTEGPPTASGTACQKGAAAASTVTKDTFISVGSPSVWPIINTLTMPPNTHGMKTGAECAAACEANVNCSSWGWAPDGHTYGGCWLKRGTRDSLIKSSVGLSSSAYKGCYSGCSTKGLAGPTGAVDCCAARSVDTGKYWVVRNSWGPDWGEDGYLRVMRDIPDLKTGDPMSNGLGGVCGVASGPSFPEPFQG